MGFQNSGFNVVAAFDNWKPAVDVYRENFRHAIEECDLADAECINEVAKYRPNVIIGGPPCQDFSSAGVNNYSTSRANLAKRFAEILDAIRPSYFVLENVPRIRHSKIFHVIEAQLRSAGYGLTCKVLDASYCGVPQVRKRVFLIGCQGEKDGFLDDIIERRVSNTRMTMKEYFGDELGIKHYFRVPTNYTRRGIFSVDEPCVTIRGIDRPIPRGYKGHPNDPVPLGPSIRGLTVFERARVQTFPREFIFNSSKTNLNQMIGNAVPVKMAEFIAGAIEEHMNRTSPAS